MERGRRATGAPSDRFAALKAARQGQSRTKQYKEAQDDDLYDEVDEVTYKTIVRGRLQQDDFIEDDDGGGYADNGMDPCDEDRHYTDEEDSDDARRKKNKASTSGSRVARPVPAVKESKSMAAYRKPVTAEKEDDFINNLLSTMDTAKTTVSKPQMRKQRPAPRKRKSSPVLETSSDGESHNLGPPTLSKKGSKSASRPPPPLGESEQYGHHDSSPPRAQKRAKFDPELEGKVSELKVEDRIEDIVMDDYYVDDLDLDIEVNFDVKPASSPEPSAPAVPKEVQSWLALHSSLLAAPAAPEEGLDASGTSASGNVDAIETDGSLQLYWLDFTEIQGKLYLIGKVLDKSSKKYVSCCLGIDGLERNLFVVPRDKVFVNGHTTDEVPSRQDVQDDFNRMRREFGIKSISTKWVKRKYAFGADDVPEGESDYLKVVYDFHEPALPVGLNSGNIAHIFGTQTSAFELFVLKRKIMGPCWLRVERGERVSTGIVSWCKAEFLVKDPKLVKPFADSDSRAPRDTPPLTMMSLALRSVVNHELNKREIVTISLRIWENVAIDNTTPPEQQPSSSHTFVRPIGKYPPGFESRARAQTRTRIVPAPNERALLGQVLGLILRYDPDVFVGHDLIGDHMEVILQRLKELKIEHWSRVGRLRRSKSVPLGKQGTNVRLVMGRLVCDLTSDAAKGMISSTTWSLTEMCASQLKISREDIDPEDIPERLDPTLSGPDRMLLFVQHCEMDAFFHMAIATKIQILPLTRQLTNLAGNSWGKTLTGARSERNEYILLHEFHRLKYICPDKSWGRQRDSAAIAQAEAEELDPEATAVEGKKGKGKSKDKYKGGLVFEPKRGLWDRYILVMDFNSLYPSIIQEYNIDFTTIARAGDEDEIPEVPPSELGQGVLPRLIATLVNRRKQVKNLMKDRGATPAQIMQWNIKQQALKLTANSMYGCLGFTGSRFYARPLAALTTYKGREILTHTRELAESMNLDVVYGDTDSVFVNSNVTDLAEALKTANQFKRLVNERYKLLEIDLDGIFQRLLLLQKKKYAAMKVDDGGKTSMEIKGLDMKRREFSPLSKTASDYVLRQILSGEAAETVVEAIHDYLRTISVDIREGKLTPEDFIINKRLGKDPEKYPDAKTQPHVQVALRMKNRGGSARGGDVIPYIFCLSSNGESSKSGQADRAYHPEELRKSKGDLRIDFEFYLASQVLPPITRLCEPIEGTDRSRLAECLGLSPDQYASVTSTGPRERQLGVLDSQIPDSERYRDAEQFNIRCAACAVVTPFSRLDEDKPLFLTLGAPACPSCKGAISSSSLELQLELHIHQHVARYYEGWMVCDDPTCGMRTRRMSVVPRKCLRQGCFGAVSFEYSDAMLYTQLLYIASLFDEHKIRVAAESTVRQNDIIQLLDSNLPLLSQLSAAVAKHLERSGRRWVDLSNLFSFMAV